MVLRKLNVVAGRQALKAVAWLAAGLVLTASAQAAENAAPANVVNFTASASADVVKDLLTVTLQVVRDGADASSVQTALKSTLDAALTEARKHVQTDALEVRTGSFTVSPRYGQNGRITGWQGSAELILEGRDVARVASTAGRLSGMNIVGSGFSVSRVSRDKTENELTALAIQKFRNRASDYAKAFGFGSYALREVQVQGLEGQEGPHPVMAMRASAFKSSADEALPVEAGRSVLTATVQGSVVLTK